MSLTNQLKILKSGKLVSPRHEQYLTQAQGNVVIPPDIIAFVASELSKPDRDRRLTFSASGRGNCARQQLFSYHNFPGDKQFTSDQSARLIHGTWTHLKWQAMGLDAGWLASVEVPCAISSMNVTGTIDGLLDTGEGWELKSINTYGFKQICAYGPLPKHLLQVHCYMIATEIDRWSIIYEDKATQDWRECVVDYDEQMAAEVGTEMAYLNDHLSLKRLPPMRDDCKAKEGSAYRQCAFREICPKARYPQ